MKSPFLTSLKEFMLARHYARKTIQTYLYWIVQYIRFHRNRHPSKLTNADVEQFLTFLVSQANASASTQNIALNALVFLYKEYLQQPLDIDLRFRKSTKHKKLPVVLTPREVKLLFDVIPSQSLLPYQLMYGSGLRLMETVRLRVKDIDFDYGALRIWQSKGGKNRVVTLAKELHSALHQQIQIVRHVHQLDLQNPLYEGVNLPTRLKEKFPNADKSLGWQFLFPARHLAQYGLDEGWYRHHIHETSLQKMIARSQYKLKFRAKA